MRQGLFRELHRAPRGSFTGRACLYSWLLSCTTLLSGVRNFSSFLACVRACSVSDGKLSMCLSDSRGQVRQTRVSLSSLVIDFCLFFFLRSMLSVNLGGYQCQVMRVFLNWGDPLNKHVEVSFADQECSHLPACQAWVSLWSDSVQQGIYFPTPPLFKKRTW